MDAAHSPAQPAAAADPFRPSGHTGMLMHAIARRAASFAHGSGLDLGMGSGVLLAALGQLGVARLCGVDIDPAAVDAARRLLVGMGLAGRAELLRGSLWEPVGARRFDVVVANLPHFPASVPADPEHSPHWSMAGPDGRMWLDPFLAGLDAHLAEGGVAFATHTTYLGLDRTAALLARDGLGLRVLAEALVPLHPDKAALMTPAVRRRFAGGVAGGGIVSVGPYEFLEAQILEIRRQPAA